MVIERILILALFMVGTYAMLAHRNLFKKVIGLSLLNSAVVLLFILEGNRIGSQAPIIGEGVTDIVDPIPQALMLTAIVIGVCTTALSLALTVKLYKATNSLDIETIKESIADEF